MWCNYVPLVRASGYLAPTYQRWRNATAWIFHVELSEIYLLYKAYVSDLELMERYLSGPFGRIDVRTGFVSVL